MYCRSGVLSIGVSMWLITDGRYLILLLSDLMELSGYHVGLSLEVSHHWFKYNCTMSVRLQDTMWAIENRRLISLTIVCSQLKSDIKSSLPEFKQNPSDCNNFCTWHDSTAIVHYNDVIMGAMASQITSLTIVYSSVYSATDQRKHQSSASLAFVRRIHRWPVNSRTKGQ